MREVNCSSDLELVEELKLKGVVLTRNKHSVIDDGAADDGDIYSL